MDLLVNFDSAKESGKYIQNITTNIRSGNDVLLKGQEIDIEGSFVRGENDVYLDAKDINVKASEDSYSSNNQSNGANLGISKIGTNGTNFGANYGEGNANGTFYNNSRVQAGNTMTVRAENMSIIGGQVIGKHTDVEVKNLIIESLQDKEQINQIGVGASVGVVHGTTSKMTPNGVVKIPDDRYNGSVGASYTNGEKAWVNEQSGIIGTESAKVNIEEKLSLIGGIIANIWEDGTDGGNLQLSYGSLETRDIHSYDNMTGMNVNVSISERAEDNKTELKLNTDKSTNHIERVKRVPNRVDETYTFGMQGHKNDKMTRATIGQGEIKSTSGTLPVGVNRDIGKADEVTHSVRIDPFNYTHKSERTTWGDFNKIMTANAGIIGDFIDDIFSTNYMLEYKTERLKRVNLKI